MNHRKTFQPLLLAAAIVIAAGSAFAATQAPSNETTAGPGRHMPRIDSNGDGVIDKTEAAAHSRLAEKFDTLDKNRDGKLDASERPSRMGSGHGDRMEHAVRLDTDGDGRISRAEAAAQPHLDERFAEIDSNRDGYLVRSELRASSEKRRAERKAQHQQQFEQEFKGADRKGDGKLSRAEVESNMPRLAESFNFLDEDRDGQLTRQDLEHSGRHR